MSRRHEESMLWARWLALQKQIERKVVLIEAGTGASWTGEAVTKAAIEFSEHLVDFAPGVRFAFRVPNGADWIALFLACQRAGLAAVPLDAGTPREGAVEIARRVGASTLYIDGKFESLGIAAAKRRAKICCIKVTSGTGSVPKAIECRAEHLLADGENVARTMGIRSGDVNLAAIPLGHSYGLGNLVMPLIMQGTAVVAASEFVPRQLLEWIGRYRVTVFPGVPALFRVLVALPAQKEKLDSLRTVISAGAMLPAPVAQAFHERFGLRIHNFYGSSETGGICYDRTGSASQTSRSVGKPLRGVTVTVKGKTITVASAAVATRNGRHCVGDFGEWNARGELVLLGRRGQGANIGGKKVNPLEVERVLRALPAVTDASVWRRQDQGRDVLAAVVESRATRGEIERALAEKLPAWKLPRIEQVAPELPRTARGKLDLAALRR